MSCGWDWKLIDFTGITYDDATQKDPSELVSVLRVEFFVKEHLLADPRVAHGVEDGHAQPKPNIEACQGATEVATALQAVHASRDCHTESKLGLQRIFIKLTNIKHTLI